MSLSILKERNFRNYFFADVIAGFGTGMSIIGGNWYILKLTGLNSSVGLLMSIAIGSGLIIFPFAGTIVDRFNRRSVIYWSNFIRAVLIFVIAGVYFSGMFRVEYLYLLAAIGGIGWSIFLPASRSLVQEIVEKDDLIKGNSLIEVSLQVGMFTAAAAGGIIYKYFGFGIILVIDALTFIIGNLFLMKIKYTPITIRDKTETFRIRFSNGLKYLKENPLIFGFGVVTFLPFVATMSSNVILPGYVSEHLKQDAVIFGLADMFYGIGAFISGVIASYIVARILRHRIIIILFTISSAILIYLFFNNHVSGLFLAMFLFGLSNSTLRIIMNTVLMEIVPKSFMGRAFAVWMAISIILQVSSVYTIGLFVDAFPIHYGYLWLATIMIVGFLLMLFFLKVLKGEIKKAEMD